MFMGGKGWEEYGVGGGGLYGEGGGRAIGVDVVFMFLF